MLLRGRRARQPAARSTAARRRLRARRGAMEADSDCGAPSLLTLLSPGTSVPHALARILGYACTPQQLHDNVAPVCRQLYDFVHGGKYADEMYGRLVVRYDGRVNKRDVRFMRQMCATLRRLLINVRTGVDVGDAPLPASMFAGYEWHRLTELELAGYAGGLPNVVPGDTLAALVGATPALRAFRASCCDLWRPDVTLTDGWPHLRTVEVRRCHADFVHCVVLQTRTVQRAQFSLFTQSKNRPDRVADELERRRPPFAEFVHRNSGTLTALNLDWRLVRRSSADEPGDMDALGRCLQLAEFRLVAGTIYDHTEQFNVAQCIRLLASLPRLQKVQLYCQAVPGSAEAALAGCQLPSVTAIHLHPWSMASSFAHAVIQMAPSLRHVHMANIDCVDDALLTAIVHTLPMLTWLRMSFATLDHNAQWLCLGTVPGTKLKHIEHIDLHVASTESQWQHCVAGLRAALLAAAGRGVAHVRFQGERLDA